jgi:predicted Zn-dependent protease
MLREAKFDVRAAPRFFERLQQYNRYNEGGARVYVQTHPVTGERMTDLQLRIQDLAPLDHRDRIEFRLLRARGLAVGSDAVDALASAKRDFDQQIGTPQGAKDPAPWYGLANVAHSSRDWAGSDRALDRAEETLNAPHVFFARLRIANSLGSGNIDRGLEQSAQAMRTYPDNLAIIRLRAQVLIAARSHREAVGLLREKTADFRATPNCSVSSARRTRPWASADSPTRQRQRATCCAACACPRSSSCGWHATPAISTSSTVPSSTPSSGRWRRCTGKS